MSIFEPSFKLFSVLSLFSSHSLISWVSLSRAIFCSIFTCVKSLVFNNIGFIFCFVFNVNKYFVSSIGLKDNFFPRLLYTFIFLAISFSSNSIIIFSSSSNFTFFFSFLIGILFKSSSFFSFSIIFSLSTWVFSTFS